MPLWVDKHRPKRLNELDFHPHLSEQLQRMVSGAGDFPHTLVYGPSGAGKKTRVMALLREMHGPSVERLRVEQRTFKFGTSQPVELTLVSSAHHIELNPSDAGIRDREVVQEVIKEIAQQCERNLRRAILALEACRVQQYPFSETQAVQLPDWQLFLRALADEILHEQSPKQLLKIRGKLYELLANCIPPDLIMRALTQELLRKVPLGVKHESIFHAAAYECRMQGGSKPIFHLEAFIARFMSVYKKHLMQAF